MPYEYPDGLIPVTAGWTKNDPADHTVMGVNNDLHGGIKTVPSVEEMLAIHPNYLGKGYTVCFVAGKDGLKSRLFELTSDPSLATGTVLADWTEWEVGGSSISPDGIVQHGTVTQSFNDLTLNTEWKWRHSNVVYSNPQSETIAIPPPAEGFTRIDLIAGTRDNSVIRIAGTAVELPAVAIPPDLVDGRIALVTAFVTDSGIAGFQEFALASFVRFDIANQGLSLVQKSNVLLNICAPSNEVDSNISSPIWRWRDWNNINRMIWTRGSGTGNDSRLEMFNGSGNRVFRVYPGTPQTGIGNLNPVFFLKGAGKDTRTVATIVDGDNEVLFSMISSGSSQWKRAPNHPDAINDTQSATLGQVKSYSAVLDYTRSEGNVAFDLPRSYGFGSSPVTGNINVSTAGAREMYMAKLKHNDTAEPGITVPAGVELVCDSGEYEPGLDNYYWFVISKNEAGEVAEVHYSITLNQL